MADSKASSNIGATPGKLAFAVVLAIIFIFVLWNEFFRNKTEVRDRSRSTSNSPTRSTAASDSLAAEASPANLASDKTISATDDVFISHQSSNIELKNLGQHDPFEMPTHWQKKEAEIEELPIAEIEKQEAEDNQVRQANMASLKALKKRGADMIIISDSQRLAIIGNETLEIGDVYEGLRVVSIEATGLTVERVD